MSVEFDPKVSYRILKAKQNRLYREARVHLLHRVEAQMEGHWYDDVFYYHDGLYEFCTKEAEKMWDVLDYLSARITFGQWGEIEVARR